MHSSTLFLVALASIMVSFTSAKGLNKENSVTGINHVFKNQGSRVNSHQKRRMRKRLSPGNSGSVSPGGTSNTYHSTRPVSPSGSSVGGLPIDSLTSGLLGSSTGGGLPLVDGLI